MKRKSQKSVEVTQKQAVEEKSTSGNACNFADNYYGDRVCKPMNVKEVALPLRDIS